MDRKSLSKKNSARIELENLKNKNFSLSIKINNIYYFRMSRQNGGKFGLCFYMNCLEYVD
jgi:hypothetical protein